MEQEESMIATTSKGERRAFYHERTMLPPSRCHELTQLILRREVLGRHDKPFFWGCIDAVVEMLHSSHRKNHAHMLVYMNIKCRDMWYPGPWSMHVLYQIPNLIHVSVSIQGVPKHEPE